ncbi:MAG: APC family permease [Pseudomonadales bacterium]|nr:APC family permease [Pseudomonadales bacterium]
MTHPSEEHSSSGKAQARFNKVLRTRDVLTLAFGAMIGWSWVLMTGLWVEQAGSLGTLFAFLGGGLAIALIGLTYSELVSAMPRAGGEHVYTHRGLGIGASFCCTWALLLAYVNVCLFEAVALPTAVEYLAPGIRIGTLWNVFGSDVDIGFVLIGAGTSVLITIINVLGIKPAARFQNFALILILIAGILLITGAIGSGSLENAQPWIATPATGILSVLIMVPALLVGFDVIPQSAEEINLPPRRIGMLLVISVFLAVAWYGVISLAVAMAMPPGALAGSSMASGDAASLLWGNPIAGSLVVLGGVAGILTSWNAFVIGGSRLLYALAGSGLVPAAFARLHPKYHTPYVGIIAIGVLSCLSPLFGRTVLVWLIDAGGFATIIAYLFVPLAFLALRRREPELPRPFRVSHPRLVGYGGLLLALALITAYLPGSPSALIWPYEWMTITIWSLLGIALFIRYRLRTRSPSDSGGAGQNRLA